jgi:hypothetical protein
MADSKVRGRRGVRGRIFFVYLVWWAVLLVPAGRTFTACGLIRKQVGQNPWSCFPPTVGHVYVVAVWVILGTSLAASFGALLAAPLIGMPIRTVVIGYGPRLFTSRGEGRRVEVRLIPLRLYFLAEYPPQSAHRARYRGLFFASQVLGALAVQPVWWLAYQPADYLAARGTGAVAVACAMLRVMARVLEPAGSTVPRVSATQERWADTAGFVQRALRAGHIRDAQRELRALEADPAAWFYADTLGAVLHGVQGDFRAATDRIDALLGKLDWQEKRASRSTGPAPTSPSEWRTPCWAAGRPPKTTWPRHGEPRRGMAGSCMPNGGSRACGPSRPRPTKVPNDTRGSGAMHAGPCPRGLHR